MILDSKFNGILDQDKVQSLYLINNHKQLFIQMLFYYFR